MDITKHYLGTLSSKEVSIEEARDKQLIVYWKCNHGHIFRSCVDGIENVLENDLCACCMKLKGEPLDAATIDCTEPDSLYNLDYEIFGGQLNKLFIQSDDNYINWINYKSQRIIDWNIQGKWMCMSTERIVRKLTERKQEMLKEKYIKQSKYEGLFKVVKCEACGKYFIHFNDGRSEDKLKCTFCNEYAQRPFTLDRWLSKHHKERDVLEEYLSIADYEMICSLDKEDKDTEIRIRNYKKRYEMVVTNPFEITHNFKSLLLKLEI